MRALAATAASVGLLALAGCGGSQPHGYFNMTTLAAHVKANAGFGTPRKYPIRVTCVKTTALEAACTPVYQEANGPEAGATFKEKIAPDGNSYESSGP